MEFPLTSRFTQGNLISLFTLEFSSARENESVLRALQSFMNVYDHDCRRDRSWDILFSRVIKTVQALIRSHHEPLFSVALPFRSMERDCNDSRRLMAVSWLWQSTTSTSISFRNRCGCKPSTKQSCIPSISSSLTEYRNQFQQQQQYRARKTLGLHKTLHPLVVR